MGFKFYQIGVFKNLPNELEIEIDGITIKQFINYLSEKYKRNLAQEIIDKNNALQPGLLLILNGKNVFDNEGLDTVIHFR